MGRAHERGRVPGIGALLLAGWLGVVATAGPASALGVRLFVDCQGDAEAERYIQRALAREFAKLDSVALVEERELAGLYVYGSRTASHPGHPAGYVLSIAHTTRFTAEVILGAFVATEPSEQQLNMVAEMAHGANHVEHLDSVYLADISLFELHGVAAALVRDFDRRAVEPLREILREMLQPIQPSEQDARPEPSLGVARQASLGPAPMG